MILHNNLISTSIINVEALLESKEYLKQNPFAESKFRFEKNNMKYEALELLIGPIYRPVFRSKSKHCK